jgi:hypothetical protein
MNRGKPLSHDPARAAEKRARRLARRAAEQRPEDVAREERESERPRRRGEPRSEDERRASAEFYRVVTASGCVMCIAFPVDPQTYRERRADIERIQAAHLISQDKLRRWGLHGRLWDPRDGLGLCCYHHFRHDDAVQRVPRRLIPAPAFVFADEIGARWVLEDDVVFPLDA